MKKIILAISLFVAAAGALSAQSITEQQENCTR